MTQSRAKFIAITAVLSLALLESTAQAQDSAQVPAGPLSPPSTVTRRGCHAASRPEARALGDRLYQQHAFDLAGQCYRVAGEYNLADLAFLKAAKPQSEATARTLATNRDEVKTQVRKLQQAFARSVDASVKESK